MCRTGFACCALVSTGARACALVMGAKQTKEDEIPTSPKSPRVAPVSSPSGHETSDIAVIEQLGKEASLGDLTLSPKSNASAKSRDDDGAASESSSSERAPPDRKASRGLFSRRLSGLLSGGGKPDNTKESRAIARTLTLRGHTDVVECLAALDGGRLASGSKDKSIIGRRPEPPQLHDQRSRGDRG